MERQTKNKCRKYIIGLKELKVKIMKKRKDFLKRKKKGKSKKKKENYTELQKPNIDAEVYYNHKNCGWIYLHTHTHTHTYTHKQNQNTSTKIKYNRLTKDAGGQRSMTCCSLWGHKELDTT